MEKGSPSHTWAAFCLEMLRALGRSVYPQGWCGSRQELGYLGSLPCSSTLLNWGWVGCV